MYVWETFFLTHTVQLCFEKKKINCNLTRIKENNSVAITSDEMSHSQVCKTAVPQQIYDDNHVWFVFILKHSAHNFSKHFHITSSKIKINTRK